MFTVSIEIFSVKKRPYVVCVCHRASGSGTDVDIFVRVDFKQILFFLLRSCLIVFSSRCLQHKQTRT